jgi:phosphoribosyl 1,2-cyclic phosphate phosphodiesterase
MGETMADREKLKITFMGTGTSHGVPMIGCQCPVCTSTDPRDRRNRCCLKLEFDGRVVIIDTPPEFRLQCIANDVRRLDAILFTHTHADHIFGLDDTRRFTALQREPIDCYGSPRTLRSLKTVFSYAFDLETPEISERPRLQAREIDGPFDLFGREVIPLEISHGCQKILGFRIGPLAYCTDCSVIPDETLEKLRDLDTLILGCLRYTPHPTHFNVDQALAAAEKIGARRTFFTHIAHEIAHADLEARLPETIRLAHDGLSLELTANR